MSNPSSNGGNDPAKEISREENPFPVPAADSTRPLTDPWQELKKFTAARIALGSTGVSVPTAEILHFKLAHAHARDAVFSQLDDKNIAESLLRRSLTPVMLHSQAKDRSAYLQRPDLGRTLDARSLEILTGLSGTVSDVAVVIADGLSAEAVNRHALPLLEALLPGFQKMNLTLAPVTMVSQGRVAIGDQIGAALKVRLLLVMIGERPGLSAPDSLGVYLTYAPRAGLTDESRNCVSNIRPEGLGYHAAAAKILYLAREALRMQLTGVILKEQSPDAPEQSLLR